MSSIEKVIIHVFLCGINKPSKHQQYFPSPGGMSGSTKATTQKQGSFRGTFVKGCPGAWHPAYCPLTTRPLRFS